MRAGLTADNFRHERPWAFVLLTGCVGIAASLLAASYYILLDSRYDAKDLVPFVFWTVPFASIVAAVARKKKLYDRRSVVARFTSAAFLGLLAGYLWTLLQGAWVGAYSFPIFPCWVAGGISVFMSGVALLPQASAVQRRAALGLTVLLSLLILTGVEPLVRVILDYQPIYVVVASCKIGQQGLELQDHPFMKEVRVESMLRQGGVTGKCQTLSGDLIGATSQDEEHVWAVVVVTQGRHETVELAQPNGNDILYVQTPEGWRQHPEGARTISRKIIIETRPSPGCVFNYWVQKPGGGTSYHICGPAR